MVLILLGEAALLVLLAAGGAWFFGTRWRGRPSLKKNHAAEFKPTQTVNQNGASEAALAAIDQSKLVIHALLRSVSDGIETLADTLSKYGNSLMRHKATVEKATTIASIRELERFMLEEIDNIQHANAHYRHALEEANARIKTQQQELEQLQIDVGLDFLTKIPNRRNLDDRLREEIARAKRYSATFALIILDIDHFKDVNDVYGHLAGDRVLRAVAQLLEEQKRAGDYLARYGGEEFALILPETSAEQAKTLAIRAGERVARAKFRCEKKSVWVTISCGVGEVAPDTDTVETLFDRVDKALYRAKAQGRNCVEIAPRPSEPLPA